MNHKRLNIKKNLLTGSIVVSDWISYRVTNLFPQGTFTNYI